MNLLEQLLTTPDRDHCPGARPLLSLTGAEPPEFARALRAALRARIELSRRGTWHGEFAELDPELAPAPPGAAPPSLRAFAARWQAARPIVLPGIALELVRAERAEIACADRLGLELGEPPALRAFVARRLAAAGSEFELLALHPRPADPERDLEFVPIASPGVRRIQDLWLKSGWLSTSEADSSLRLRVSFGREREDDASPDLLRLRLVARLGGEVLPAAAALAAHAPLVGLVEALLGEPALLTQPIAYWNAPEGGALFHHDAFVEDLGQPAGLAQRGVLYTQLSGATLWLALSTQDLALRVREFVETLAAGELAWVRAQLCARAGEWEALLELCARPSALELELALPGCGRLGPLVNRGPEFSALLADAGHAWLLEPGDAILLPNHGPCATAMHSVFCASEETGYALSLALRADRVSYAETEAGIAPEGP